MNHLADIILFPLYTALFALVFYFRRRRLKDPILRRYHRNAFWLKVFSAFAFIIFSLFLAKLDSTHLYYPEGMNITRLILKDFSNIRLLFIEGKEFDPDLLADTLNRGYFSSESNFFIARLVSVLSFISFGSYSVITLLFSLISFTGVWRLYRFFYEQYPHLHRQLAIAVLYLPNFVFWSSGILKDPLCTGMLGWFTYGMYRIFIRKESILLYSFVSLVSGYILGLVKAYILVSFLPFLLLFIIITKLRRIQATAIRVILFISILIVGGIGVWLVGARLQSEMEELALSKITESVQSTQQNFMRIADLAESSFSLGVEYDGTAAGLLRIAPAGIVATLFRPYLWESKKLSSLLSALESSALLLFTIYVFFRVGPFRFVGSIIRDPMIQFCIFFALVFSLFVGVTTLNFGTLVRYKIPCMPFYIVGLVLILERYKPFKQSKAVFPADEARPI